MRTVCCTFAVALALGLPLRASAQFPDTPPISYRAPGQCPGQAGFLRRLRARLGASQAILGPGRSIDVQIAASDGRFQGRLSLIGPDGRSTAKTLSDADCEALVDALSLVATLALETDRAEPGGGNSTPATAVAPAGASASSPGPAPTAAPPAAPGSAPTAAPAAPPSASPSAPSLAPHASSGADVERSTSPAAASQLGAALGGFAATGPARQPLFGAVLTSSWVWPSTGLFRPTLEIGAAASLSPDTSVAQGSASFTWWTARVVGYLLQWPSAGVALRAGLAGDFGLLVARGHDTPSPATSSRPWASLGAALGLDLPFGSGFVLRPTAALEAPLRRDRYAFGSVDFFEVSSVIAIGGVTIVAYLR
jgi:hypothetical protein